MIFQTIANSPHETTSFIHRDKRQGGGGIIPFRPLFVYRQQQREMQEKWKEIEARKKLRHEQELQYQQYQAYLDTIRSPQQSYQSHPPTLVSSNHGAQHSSFHYPTKEYISYPPSYPTYLSDQSSSYYTSEYDNDYSDFK